MIPQSSSHAGAADPLTRCILTGIVLLLTLISGLRAEDDPDGRLAQIFETTDLRKLAETNKEIQIYRLTVVRSFDSPLQFELVRDKFEHAFEVKKAQREVNGPGYRYTKLMRNSRLKLQEEETKSFAVLLEAAQFWSMPEEDWRRQGLDGSTWTLEGIRDGKYHKVVRDNPFLSVAEFEKIENLSGPKTFPALSAGRAYGEGLLAAALVYLWTLSGEAGEELY